MRECGPKIRSIVERLFIQRIRRDRRTYIRKCEFGFSTEVFQENLRAYREGMTIGQLMDAALKKYKSHHKVREDNS